MEHHLVGETVQVLEKLEREIMAELAKAHNDTLKANLNEIREHLQKLNMKNGSRRPFKHTRKSLQGRRKSLQGRRKTKWKKFKLKLQK